jgi:hypothetical protein
MKKFVSITISLIILFLIIVAVYKSYTPNSKIQKAADESAETSAISEALPETSLATTSNVDTISSVTTAANETTSTSNMETALVTTETTAGTTDINLPTLKLIVYEGPVAVQDSGGMVYYRVEAKVTGNPAPFIKFSRDDSGGVWGKNIAQINLKNGESYDLVVTAVNSLGSVRKHIVLTWSQ